MTPEAIARQIIAEPDWVDWERGEFDMDKLRAHIAAAIRNDRERLVGQLIDYLREYPGQCKVGYANTLRIP